MTREELTELNALVAENDMITMALANLAAGGLLCAANVGPNPDYVAPVSMIPMMPPMGMASPVNVPVKGDAAAVTAALQDYLTARQTAVQGELAARGATQSAPGAEGAQAQQAQPQQRPGQPQQQPIQRPQPQRPGQPQR
jgi:hypothetical protein